MKRHTVSVVLGLFLAVALVALAAPASAEMYVEGYLGGTAAANMGQNFVVHESKPTPPPPNTITVLNASRDFGLNYPGKVDPSIIGGVKLGTWFVHEGFAGYSGFPDWMKYFGFYTDLSYQSLEMPSQRLTGFNFFNPGASGVAGTFSSPEGMQPPGTSCSPAATASIRIRKCPSAACNLMWRVGPAVMFTTMDPKLQANGLNFGPEAETRGHHRPVGGVRG